MRATKGMTGVLILVELGAEWPFWVEGLTGRSSRSVVAQAEGESPEVFAERVAEHVSDLAAKRVPLDLAVVACNERSDGGAMSARTKLSQALLGTLASKRSARLLFTASGRTGRVRHALAALSSDLSATWSRGSASERVAVRFSDEMPLARRAASVA